MEFNLSVGSERLALVARLLGEEVQDLPPVDGAKKAVDAIRRVLGTLGLPSRLRDFDLVLDSGSYDNFFSSN